MAFTVPVTLTQTGLVSPNTQVSNTTSITQEVVTQIQVTVASGSTTPIYLNITDTTKVNLLAITTDKTVSYKFDFTGNSGWSYTLSDMVVLFNDSLRIYDNSVSSTPNELMTMYVTNGNTTPATINVVIVTSNN